jgi:hypothetical protein
MQGRGWHPLDLVPAAIGAWLAFVLGSIWAARLPYPYDLEWMEGGMLAHAWRIQHGKPIYVEPGPDFVPFLYPPGYPALLAALGSIFELGAPLGRAVSLGGSLAAAAAIVFVVARRAGSPLMGVFGGLLFLGTYPEAGAFHDIVRNDGLFLGLLAWSVALATERGRYAPIASGALLFLSFVVKHNGAIVGLPILASFWLRDGRGAALKFALASAAPALLTTAALQITTGGLFVTYLIAVPGSHAFVYERLVPGTPWELGQALPIALLGASIWLVSRAGLDRRGVIGLAALTVVLGVAGVEDLVIPRVSGIQAAGKVLSAVGFAGVGLGVIATGLALRRPSPDRVLGIGVAALLVLMSALMRGHFGGFVNVHMPMFWVASLAFAFAMARWRASDASILAAAAPALAMAAQLGWQVRNLDAEKLVPTAEDRDVGDQIVEILRHAPEPVLSPFAPWLPVQAGHEPGWHLIALWDVSKHEQSPFAGSGKVIEEAMKSHHWGSIVDGTKTMQYRANEHYEVSVKLPGDKAVFMPKTGWRTRPRALLVPRR